MEIYVYIFDIDGDSKSIAEGLLPYLPIIGEQMKIGVDIFTVLSRVATLDQTTVELTVMGKSKT